MAGVSFHKPQVGVNTDRIAASSRAFTPQKSAETTSAEREKNPSRREMFAPDASEPFVEKDGKRYYLNAPRGTYLDIFV